MTNIINDETNTTPGEVETPEEPETETTVGAEAAAEVTVAE
jgi:hypothetical protein